MRLANAADFRNPQSLSRRLRQKRSAFFEQLIAPLVKPLRVLDVGGTEDFWQSLGYGNRDDVWVTLLNLTATATSSAQFVSIAGDARDLSQFKRREFDVVFSNSVIEHVGDFHEQKRMADEVQRVGKRYFVQTPNRYFPVEPHFLFPWFQFLPEAVQVWLLGRFRLGTYDIVNDRDYARGLVREIRLLSLREFSSLFPVANIYRERLLGMNKSFVAYGGWETI
jgi:hypothetical protein